VTWRTEIEHFTRRDEGGHDLRWNEKLTPKLGPAIHPPGFTIRDSAGVVWFIKVDPPGHNGMATGTEVVATKLFWALGYHVPEVHLAQMHRDDLVVSEEATITTEGGSQRRMRTSDIEGALKRAARDPDGSYRVVASKRIEGPV